jgi:hypothetical protein
MTQISYAEARTPVRADLIQAHEQLWQNLAEPGTWWTGAERVAIAAEVRVARACPLCTDRKSALSPAAVEGQHDTHGVLPSSVVDMIHRISTDPGRLSQNWYERLLADGVEDTHYVEALGVVVRTVSIDSFCRGVGIPPHPLPTPIPGEPSRRRPPQAQTDVAWVPMIPSGQETGPDADIYWGQPAPNVARAMSLVPDEVRASLHILLPAQYLDPTKGIDPTHSGGRAISRAQMELLAARVSALNECFY